MKAYDKADLIEKLKEEERFLGRVPKSEDIDKASVAGRTPSVEAYKNHFITFNNALKIAGFKVNRISKYTKKVLLSDLRDVYENLRRIPTIKELGKFNKEGIMAERTVYLNHFKTMESVYTILEIDLVEEGKKRLEMRRNKLIQQIQSLSDKEKKDLTKSKWLSLFKSKKSKLSHFDTFIDEFGEWSKALEAAGVYSKRKRYSSDKLLEILKKEYTSTNQAPKSTYFDQMSKQGLLPSAGSYSYHFGSWNNALVAANIPLP